LILGGCPQYWVIRCGVWEGTLKVGEDHECLWLERVFLDVFKAKQGQKQVPPPPAGSSVIGSPCSKMTALCTWVSK
jgi:hypothetical protein